MIQINLLDAPSRAIRWKDWVPVEQRPAAVGLVMLLVTALGSAGWWWELQREAAAIDLAIASAQRDVSRLNSIATLVDRAAAHKAELMERLGLIDRLHRTQRDPVELLEAVSRSVPDGLWLMDLKQQNETIQIEGRAETVTAITDFVERLQTSGHFRRPIDILTTSMETVQDAPVVRFAIKAIALRAALPASGGAATPPPAGGS